MFVTKNSVHNLRPQPTLSSHPNVESLYFNSISQPPLPCPFLLHCSVTPPGPPATSTRLAKASHVDVVPSLNTNCIQLGTISDYHS